MIRLTRDLAIAPAAVSCATVEQRQYMNSPGPTYLIIRMVDGREHRIEHTPHLMDGVDVYSVLEALTAGDPR